MEVLQKMFTLIQNGSDRQEHIIIEIPGQTVGTTGQNPTYAEFAPSKTAFKDHNVRKLHAKRNKTKRNKTFGQLAKEAHKQRFHSNDTC